MEVIKQRLIEQLSALLLRAGRISDHLRDSPPKDWEELATHRENDEVVEALDEMTKNEIERIKQALRRMDSGEWGSCILCGEEINPERLEALPTTTLCIDCANRQE